MYALNIEAVKECVNRVLVLCMQNSLLSIWNEGQSCRTHQVYGEACTYSMCTILHCVRYMNYTQDVHKNEYFENKDKYIDLCTIIKKIVSMWLCVNQNHSWLIPMLTDLNISWIGGYPNLNMHDLVVPWFFECSGILGIPQPQIFHGKKQFQIMQNQTLSICMFTNAVHFSVE